MSPWLSSSHGALDLERELRDRALLRLLRRLETQGKAGMSLDEAARGPGEAPGGPVEADPSLSAAVAGPHEAVEDLPEAG